MNEATHKRDLGDAIVLVDALARSGGEIVQLASGRAAYRAGLKASDAGESSGYVDVGQILVPKTASVVILDGGKVFWDISAGSATYKLDPGTGDFLLGLAIGDAAGSDDVVLVDLNKQQVNLIEWGRGIWDSVAVKTAGTVIPNISAGLSGTDPGGSGCRFTFSATNEAQKVDALSRQSIPMATPFILSGRVAIYDIGDDAALDINVGVANATHATDADSITESAFLHLDGTSLNINAESDDGTTEVAATDTTVDAVDDTYFCFDIDARDLEDVKFYINGAQVLPDTTFKLDAATGPLKALLHVEKTANDTLADVRVDYLNVRTFDVKAE
jgi:hypothetical protein